MELVLTEARGGGYRAHRPTCKKLAGSEQFDPEEFNSEVLQNTVGCSSCKPKSEDMEAMLASGIQEGDALHVDADEEGTEEQVEAYESGEPPEPHDDEWSDDEDLLGDDTDEDLLGEEPEAPAEKPVDPPKVKAAPKPKAQELKAEEADALVIKVVDHLGLNLPEFTFPGFGKAIKTPGKETVYLNSKGTADVRASSPEQAAQWVEEGLAERRGGNYVRVNVRAL